MHDLEIIPDFSVTTLCALMAHAKLPAKPSKYQGVDSAKRSFATPRRQISYDIYLEDEMMKFIGHIEGASPTADALIEWNNTKSITPAIGMTDGVTLVFDVNVRRSLPFATFRKVAQSYDQAIMELGRLTNPAPGR